MSEPTKRKGSNDAGASTSNKIAKNDEDKTLLMTHDGLTSILNCLSKEDSIEIVKDDSMFKSEDDSMFKDEVVCCGRKILIATQPARRRKRTKRKLIIF